MATVYLRGPGKVATVLTWALPTPLGLPLPAWPTARSPILSNQLAVHTFFTHKNGHQRAQLGAGPPALPGR